MQFFGTHDFGWLTEQEVKPYEKFRDGLIGGAKTLSFQRAIKEIDQYILGNTILNTIKEPIAPKSGLIECATSKSAPPQNDTKQDEIDGDGDDMN